MNGWNKLRRNKEYTYGQPESNEGISKNYADTHAQKQSLLDAQREDAKLRAEQSLAEERRRYRSQVMQQRENLHQSRGELEAIRSETMRGLDRQASARGLHGTGLDQLSRVQSGVQLGQGVSELERAGSMALGQISEQSRYAQEDFDNRMRQADLDYREGMFQADAELQSSREQQGALLMELAAAHLIGDEGSYEDFRRLVGLYGLDPSVLSLEQQAMLDELIGRQQSLEQDGDVNVGLNDPRMKDAFMGTQTSKSNFDLDGKTSVNFKGANQQIDVMREYMSPDLYDEISTYMSKNNLKHKPNHFIQAFNTLLDRGDQRAIDAKMQMKRINYNPADGVERAFKLKQTVGGYDLSFDNPFQLETWIENNYTKSKYKDRLGVVVDYPSHLGEAAAGNIRVYFYDKNYSGSGKPKRFSTLKKFEKHIDKDLDQK